MDLVTCSQSQPGKQAKLLTQERWDRGRVNSYLLTAILSYLSIFGCALVIPG